jgi:hypothetical protein
VTAAARFPERRVEELGNLPRRASCDDVGCGRTLAGAGMVLMAEHVPGSSQPAWTCRG